MDEYLRHRGKARTIGLPFEVIGPEEIRRLHPLVETRGLLGAVWNPEDGHVDPTSVTQALVKGARDRGARVHRHTRVTGARADAGRGVAHHHGPGRLPRRGRRERRGDVGARDRPAVGLDLPIVPMEHQYLVTEAIPEVAALGRELPLLREVDVSYYLRQEAHGLLLGPYERGQAVRRGGIPPTFGADLLPPDPERLQTIVEAAMARVPVLARAGIQRIVNGPITYTPDGNPLIGPAFGLRGYWLACGLSFGITQAGGAGRYLAEWIVEGQPSIDLWEVDPRRYGPYATERLRGLALHRHLRGRVRDRVSAGRPPAGPAGPDRARSTTGSAPQGAVFGVRNGWERPYWFAPPGTEPRDRPSFRRTNWFDAVGREARAVRERAGILELSSFSKYEVRGPGAGALLDRLCANRLPRARPDRPLPAPTARGTIECDVTVTRLEPERFLVLSAAVAELHDLDWLQRHAPADGSVAIENVTARSGVLILAGPRARDVLGAGDRRRSLERRVPVAHRAADPGRLGARARPADQLRGRARLGAPPPHRVPDRAVRALCGARVRTSVSSTSVSARWTRCGWRRATGRGAPTSTPR